MINLCGCMYTCTHVGTSQIESSQNKTWPIMTIIQSTELSITDSLRMSLTCIASVGQNNLSRFDIGWSGMDLEHSLWLEQSHVTKHGENIEKKLFFKPWLYSLAGEYTCHLFKKNHPHSILYSKSYVISGMRITKIHLCLSTVIHLP